MRVFLLLPACPNISLHWGIQPWQDQGLLLPLVPNKAILCYICSWSHGSVHVYSLGSGLVPGVLVSWHSCSLGLQTHSAPSILSLTPPLGTSFSVQWLAASIHLCVCQALAKPLRGQLYQAPVSIHFLASAIVTGFGGCIWDRLSGGAVSG